MNDKKIKPSSFLSYSQPVEFKIVALRECPVAQSDLVFCQESKQAVAYWDIHIRDAPIFNPECECLAVLVLDSRLRIKGHQIVTVGTMDTVLAHSREVFRGAILASAARIILMHNHPSGDPTPSEADIRVTRDIFRAGELLKIALTDHIIVGAEKHISLRELGYLYS